MDELRDPRPATAFKTVTFSGHQRVAVRKALLKALNASALEAACHWAAELVASGLFCDVWDMALLCFGKHIHGANPRVASYLALRADSFRDVANASPTELAMRNNPGIRRLVAEVMCVLCASPKSHPSDEVAVSATDFSLAELHRKVKAPKGDYATAVAGDAPEIAIPVNELAYALSVKRGLEACYWLEWLLAFEKACAKKKSKVKAAARPYADGRTDLVWVFWDQVFAALKGRPTHEALAKATLRLFLLRFTPALHDAKRFLLYFAIALCCEVDPAKELVYDKKGIDAVLAKCNGLYVDLAKR